MNCALNRQNAQPQQKEETAQHTHHLARVSWALHSRQRKQAAWNLLPSAATEGSAAYTLFAHTGHFAPPPNLLSPAGAGVVPVGLGAGEATLAAAAGAGEATLAAAAGAGAGAVEGGAAAAAEVVADSPAPPSPAVAVAVDPAKVGAEPPTSEYSPRSINTFL